MKSNHKFEKIAFGCIYSIILVVTIVLLALKQFGNALFVGFPMLVLFPTYLTFLWEYQGKAAMQSMIFGGIIRLVLILIGVLVPALIWRYVPALQTGSSFYMFLVSAAEMLGLYLLVIIHFTKLGGKNGKNGDNGK